MKFIKKKTKVISIFSNSKLKWYDPAAGMGSFSINIFYRLMEGLKNKFTNETKRKKHIVENMLYMSELNKKNCYVINKIFNNKEYKLNTYCGNSLEIDIVKTFGFEKFDIIIGNPPFQDHQKSGDNKKYLEMTQKAISDLKKNGYLMFITPRNITDYLLLHEKNRMYIDKFYDLPFISIDTCNKYFKVSSSFVWFILQNNAFIKVLLKLNLLITMEK